MVTSKSYGTSIDFRLRVLQRENAVFIALAFLQRKRSLMQTPQVWMTSTRLASRAMKQLKGSPQRTYVTLRFTVVPSSHARQERLARHFTSITDAGKSLFASSQAETVPSS